MLDPVRATIKQANNAAGGKLGKPKTQADLYAEQARMNRNANARTTGGPNAYAAEMAKKQALAKKAMTPRRK